jgi:apolipoprotein D and lipocalin family protein
MNTTKLARRSMLGLLALAPAACAAPSPLQLAENVDLDRYFGRWYIIANIPYFAERGNVGAYVEYYRRPDGDIADVYYAHDASFYAPLTRREGRAYVVPGHNNALWRVTFLWPVFVSYPILYVSPDYETALIGYPDRSLGWVFSRKPIMDDATYRALLGRFVAQGYDITQFRRVPQQGL